MKAGFIVNEISPVVTELKPPESVTYALYGHDPYIVLPEMAVVVTGLGSGLQVSIRLTALLLIGWTRRNALPELLLHEPPGGVVVDTLGWKASQITAYGELPPDMTVVMFATWPTSITALDTLGGFGVAVNVPAEAV